MKDIFDIKNQMNLDIINYWTLFFLLLIVVYYYFFGKKQSINSLNESNKHSIDQKIEIVDFPLLLEELKKSAQNLSTNKFYQHLYTILMKLIEKNGHKNAIKMTYKEVSKLPLDKDFIVFLEKIYYFQFENIELDIQIRFDDINIASAFINKYGFNE